MCAANGDLAACGKLFTTRSSPALLLARFATQPAVESDSIWLDADGPAKPDQGQGATLQGLAGVVHDLILKTSKDPTKLEMQQLQQTLRMSLGLIIPK